MKHVWVVLALAASGTAFATECTSPGREITRALCDRMVAQWRPRLQSDVCGEIASIWQDSLSPLARVTCVNGTDTQNSHGTVSYAVGTITPTLITSEEQWNRIFKQAQNALGHTALSP